MEEVSVSNAFVSSIPPNSCHSWQFVWICKNNFMVLFIIAGIPIEISEFNVHVDSLFLQIHPPVL
jgi:hypothetical protein